MKIYKKLLLYAMLIMTSPVLVNASTVQEVNIENSLTLTSDLYHKLQLPLEGNVVIPETVTYKGKQYIITRIGKQLFRENKKITSVTLPDTVTYIGEYAFDMCSNLKEVVFPKRLTFIGKAAFQLCSSLEHINLPDTVEYIGNFAFNHCSGILDKEFRIPASLKSIGHDSHYTTHTFYDYGKDRVFARFYVPKVNKYFQEDGGILYTKDGKSLISIPRGRIFADDMYVMPDTVKNLGELSFSRNKNIKYVVISDKLIIDKEQSKKEKKDYINNGNDIAIACYNYTNVKKYDVKKTNPLYCSVDGVIYTKDMNDVIAIPNNYEGTLKFPENVVHLGNESLWLDAEFKDISRIEIPASMTEIDDDQVLKINELVNKHGITVKINPDNSIYELSAKGRIKKIDEKRTGVMYAKTRLHIRTKPEDGDIVKTIEPGDAVLVNSVKHGWAELEDGNYCCADFLEF